MKYCKKISRIGIMTKCQTLLDPKLQKAVTLEDSQQNAGAVLGIVQHQLFPSYNRHQVTFFISKLQNIFIGEGCQIRMSKNLLRGVQVSNQHLITNKTWSSVSNSLLEKSGQGFFLLLHAKVKSAPSPRPKTGV